MRVVDWSRTWVLVTAMCDRTQTERIERRAARIEPIRGDELAHALVIALAREQLAPDLADLGEPLVSVEARGDVTDIVATQLDGEELAHIGDEPLRGRGFRQHEELTLVERPACRVDVVGELITQLMLHPQTTADRQKGD